MDIVVVAIITVVVLALWLGSNYRNLTASRVHIDTDWKALDELLKRRHTLVAELLEKHRTDETRSMALGEAREKSRQASTPADRSAAETALSNAMGEYFQYLERDGLIIEDQQYLLFRDKFVQLEDDITAALSKHNNDVAFFNAQHKVFPTSFFVKQFKFSPLQEFPLEDAFGQHPLKFKATLPTRKRTPVSEVTQPGAVSSEAEKTAAAAKPAANDQPPPAEAEKPADNQSTDEAKSAEAADSNTRSPDKPTSTESNTESKGSP
jgi:hypothetical protein